MLIVSLAPEQMLAAGSTPGSPFASPRVLEFLTLGLRTTDILPSLDLLSMAVNLFRYACSPGKCEWALCLHVHAGAVG